MPPRLRKVALTAHVTTWVGWLGAVAVFLALALALATVAGLRIQLVADAGAALLVLLVAVVLSVFKPQGRVSGLRRPAGRRTCG
jgi:hypothetical protein